jgi:hypothetical protein
VTGGRLRAAFTSAPRDGKIVRTDPLLADPERPKELGRALLEPNADYPRRFAHERTSEGARVAGPRNARAVPTASARSGL